MTDQGEWAEAGTYQSESVIPPYAYRNADGKNDKEGLPTPTPSDLLSHSIHTLLSLNTPHWTINTRLKGDNATHEWIRLSRIEPWMLNLIDIQRERVIKSTPSSSTGVGFNTYVHCAIDRGLALLDLIDEFAEFKSLRLRARRNIHLASPEQEYLLDSFKQYMKISLTTVDYRNIPISQSLGKRLGGFGEDSPLGSNDACVVCVALALKDEIGVHKSKVVAIDQFIDGVRRQVAFKMTGLEPMVLALERKAKLEAEGNDDDNETDIEVEINGDDEGDI